ncbi:SH3 domain-containing protein [Sphingosinicella sp.]|uniref:SH3 domain-containing protein n=1 Tax=Sphingosinicella sp. TaxID=1917971 RepID=UPI004037E04E
MNASDATSTESQNAAAAAQAGHRTSADSSSSTAKSFRLAGPSVRLDPRINAFRDDLADIALSDRVLAPHYARPMARAALSAASVHASPNADAEQVASLAPGAIFAVLEFAGGWAWGFVQDNHLVGYVPAAALDQSTHP